MYCKNCGRQLKEGMRFCDRCGQSVRKSKQSSQAARHREIEELKAERLNRKKRLAEKEAKQARNKQRKKKNGNAFAFVIVILLIAVVSVIIGYNIFPKSGGNGTITATTSPTADNKAAALPVTTPSGTASAVKSGYSEITVSSITCPYPSSFHSNTTSGNEKLNITDSLGGANMVVSQEAKSGEPKELMKEYISEIGADGNPIMHAGSEWYSVTATVDDKVYHRKCIVRNGLTVYYDFTYDASSSSSKKYEEYTDYIDSNFK
ncbi:MAG: zinc-ribbon domain-containing protein [Hominilimicola sp.]